MKVLVVDDHALIRDALSVLLPALDRDFTPLTAANCDEAFAVLEATPDIGIVLMDLALPGMSGTEGIRALRSKYPDLPVVALSGSTDHATILDCIKSGAMAFIPKAYSGDRLLGVLRYVLVHGGTFLPAEIALRNGDNMAAMATPTEWPLVETRAKVVPRSLGLTERQSAVLRLVLQGKSNKAIARDLEIENTTVRTHVTAVLRALNATTRTEAVIAAHRINLVFADV